MTSSVGQVDCQMPPDCPEAYSRPHHEWWATRPYRGLRFRHSREGGNPASARRPDSPVSSREGLPETCRLRTSDLSSLARRSATSNRSDLRHVAARSPVSGHNPASAGPGPSTTKTGTLVRWDAERPEHPFRRRATERGDSSGLPAYSGLLTRPYGHGTGAEPPWNIYPTRYTRSEILISSSSPSTSGSSKHGGAAPSRNM